MQSTPEGDAADVRVTGFFQLIYFYYLDFICKVQTQKFPFLHPGTK